MSKFDDVHVQLSGEDGNVFAIIARVSKAMKKAGYIDEAYVFCKAAAEADSYDAVLRLCMQTVDVS